MAGLGFLTGGTFSKAQGVNADGTVVVGLGEATAVTVGNSEAFRWTQAGGMAGLGVLTGGNSSQALGVNADGTAVVGFGSATGISQEAFRWTQAGGMAGLGFLTGGTISQAFGVNADGTVVVGFGSATGTGPHTEAFRWTQSGGMQSVQALLTAKGVSTTGWTLTTALGVSADGQVIVGFGTDPNGHTQGWIANLGPTTVPFLSFNAQLQIHFGRRPHTDTFTLQSSFTLSSTAPEINPVTDPVTLQVGTFTTTIPPGSFKKNRNGSFTFVGVVGGVSLQAVIAPTGTLRYAFVAAAQRASLTGTTNPVTVMLAIGADNGTISVTARIR